MDPVSMRCKPGPRSSAVGDKKEICKWSEKRIDKHWDKLKKIVAEPRHICRDCGRVANEDQWLCKPEKLT